MKKLFKKFYNIIMMTLHVIFYVFDILISVLLRELNLVSAGRCYEETINAIVILCKAIRKYSGIEWCNRYLDSIHEMDIVAYYDVVDRMN